jgi:hypothetical protein
MHVVTVGFIQIMVTKCVFVFVIKFCNLVIYFSENEKDLGEKNLLNMFSFTFLFVCTTLINLENFLTICFGTTLLDFMNMWHLKIALDMLLMLLIDLIILCKKI